MTAVAANPSTATHIVEFIGVDKAFGKRVIYENLDFRVRRGETVTLLGGSGKGKSVCLKMIVGLLDADSGRIEVEGRNVRDMDANALRELRTEVSMVFQGGALFDSMSVGENIAYPLEEHESLPSREVQRRVLECLDVVGLGHDEHPDIIDMMPVTLSGGMRKRVALARSVIMRPKIILYDEPTTGLDPANSTKISRMIRKLQREFGVTSIVVTHDMALAWHVSDRVAMLHERRIPYIAEVEAFRAIEDPVVSDFIRGRTD